MDRLTIQVSTYNVNQRLLSQDPFNWLFPTYDGPKPDLFAIGFQELEPYSTALLGMNQYPMNEKAIILQNAINKGTGETYSIISQTKYVGTALFIYSRNATVTDKIRNVQFTTVGCGPLYLGTKGAIGIQMKIALSSVIETFYADITFVCAHLTAHDHNIRRRNLDYASIVSRLIFPRAGELFTMFCTRHLFFFGDLNYRISLKHQDIKDELTLDAIANEFFLDSQEPSQGHSFSRTLSSSSSSLSFDSLSLEHKGNRVLQGLNEGKIDFPPSYKYKVGKVNEFHPISKRVPGWTDRILYRPSDTIVLFYSSFSEYTMSDHKPITGVYSISLTSLAHHTPTPKTIDPRWWEKKMFGLVLDRVIGLVWVGLGTKEGLPVTLGFFAIIYYYLYLNLG